MSRLVASFTALAILLPAVALATVKEDFNATHPLSENGSVSLSNANGNVEIEGWDRPEVSIKAVKSARNQEELDRMKIVVETRDGHVSIRTEHEKKMKWFNNSRGDVTYQLMVPRTAALKKIDVVNSRIQVKGVSGHMDLDSVNGSIVVSGAASSGNFDTVNGSITVAYTAMQGVEKIVLDTVNGSCNLTLPSDAAFNLKADSVNGRVTCDFPITLESSGRHKLTGSVNGGGTKVVLDSVNGALRVKK